MNDQWARAAVLSASGQCADGLLHVLLNTKLPQGEGHLAILVELCRSLGESESAEKLGSLVDEIAAEDTEQDAEWQLAALTGLAEGWRERPSSGAGRLHLHDLISGDSPVTRLTRERVEFLIQNCAEQTQQSSVPLAARVIALRFLAETSPTDGIFMRLIEPQQPVELQVAAIQALDAMPEPAIIPLIAGDRWSTYSPPVRDALLACILAQPVRINALLDAIAAGKIPAWAVNRDRRDQLGRNPDAAIKARAAGLFKEDPSSDRMKVYADYQSILALTPNPTNGHAVFTRTCTGCHMFAGEGHLVGPDLTGIRNQPGATLLLHIIVPEYEIVPVYTCYNVTTKNGETITGLLAAETPASITIRQALGHEETISRANLVRMTASRLSLMPDELEKTMTRQELADLIGFLKGL